jgi:hypothetical protein
MRHYLFAAVIALHSLAAPMYAQETPMQKTIHDQLDDFNDCDADAAWELAAPVIHDMFGTPENFAAMVQAGYPMVWRHSAFEMLDARAEAGHFWQRVRITDMRGQAFDLDYLMIEQPEGWRVMAVQVLEPLGAGA